MITKTIKASIRESVFFLRHIRRYVWFAAAIYASFILIGYALAESYPAETAGYYDEIESYYNSIDLDTSWEMFVFIFENNVRAMLIAIALGVFAGLVPFFSLAMNGIVLGLLASVSFHQYSWLVFVSSILPHGIIEIPCFLFATAIGLMIGGAALRKLFGKDAELIEEVAGGVRFYILALIPLLLLAAAIEAYITPYFMDWALSVTGA